MTMDLYCSNYFEVLEKEVGLEFLNFSGSDKRDGKQLILNYSYLASSTSILQRGIELSI